jgi:hypothetical protein
MPVGDAPAGIFRCLYLVVEICVCIWCFCNRRAVGWGCYGWQLKLRLLICSFRSVLRGPGCLLHIRLPVEHSTISL